MKAILFAVFLAMASVLPAEGMNGASWWNGMKSTDRITQSGGFTSGYFDTVIDKFPWSEADRDSWYGLLLQIDAGTLYKAVNAFYADPANKDVGPARAMRLCLESLIAKTRDGPRLLAAIGVQVHQ